MIANRGRDLSRRLLPGILKVILEVMPVWIFFLTVVLQWRQFFLNQFQVVLFWETIEVFDVDVLTRFHHCDTVC